MCQSPNVTLPHFSRAASLTLPGEAWQKLFNGAVMIMQQPSEARRALQVLEDLVNYYQTSERNEGNCSKVPGKENVQVRLSLYFTQTCLIISHDKWPLSVLRSLHCYCYGENTVATVRNWNLFMWLVRFLLSLQLQPFIHPQRFLNRYMFSCPRKINKQKARSAPDAFKIRKIFKFIWAFFFFFQF